MRIVESTNVDAPRGATYEAFADLHRWPRILPDTVGVEVFYDDGYNQEFTMTVLRPGGEESVRGFRFCRAPEQLELVQTTPPPRVARMVGVWDFEPGPDGSTVVTATRDVELRSEDGASPDAPADFEEKLRLLLRKNLGIFKEAIENES